MSSGYAPFGLGSDTGGSIRIPSGYCRLDGLRPTFGPCRCTGCCRSPGASTPSGQWRARSLTWRWRSTCSHRTASRWDPGAARDFLRSVPQHRFGESDEIADAVLFLASDESTYITGQNLVIDGGTTLGMSIGTPQITMPTTAGESVRDS